MSEFLAKWLLVGVCIVWFIGGVGGSVVEAIKRNRK